MNKNTDMEKPVSVCFYDSTTGMFAGRSFTGPRKALEKNTPEGMTAIVGEYDHLSKRVDIETGEVVDYKPPQPGPEYQWNDEARRWQVRPDDRRKRAAGANARTRIQELEATQLRPLRELAIDHGNEEARLRLKDIEREIDVLRKDLR